MLIRSLLCSASCISRTNFLQHTVIRRLISKKIRSIILSQEKKYGTYEADGKTVGFILNKKNSPVLMLDSVGVEGFTLSDGRQLVGSIIIFPHTLLAWHVLSAGDVNEESLTLFKLLEPKLDILVFGYGAPHQFTREMREKFTGICRKLGVRFEALPTHQAAGLYNFMADERRFVAGALIPPVVVDALRFDRKKHLRLEAGLEDEEIEGEKELDAIESGKSNHKFLK